MRSLAQLALLSCASFVACSLLAPNDDYFLRDAPPPRSLGGSSSSGAPSEGGESGVVGGTGGAPAGAAGMPSAGAAGEPTEASGGHGGEGVISPCQGDLREENGACVSLSGCSDGAREGFMPLVDWPNIAGCTAKWPRASLRAPKTGLACGFESEICAVPADACGEGWHVCAAPPFGPTEISDQATAEQCAAQPGAFVAAVGDQFCEPCSETGDGAACCGERCVQQNGNCIYPGQTAWFGVFNGYKNVCGAIESELVQRGVLCCRDR
jgi:hypothetical protein